MTQKDNEDGGDERLKFFGKSIIITDSMIKECEDDPVNGEWLKRWTRAMKKVYADRYVEEDVP
jgi:hypothetical protein